ncbi:3-hydroxyacyl-CoA dehydrogenase family protein [Aridibaculum aurantiacum]|uniref:3-hydroxyacyl-CoA dehydrogenase family protein n=1 Tax=Aridibaculum aurantiacum TaxID=2810307 RepID=UPI001A96EFE5|nr:3-hydroxyacyl-CoA dehydrogenase family protein [Aridibaculum aurantiacum]
MEIVVIAEGLKQNEFHDKGIAEGVKVQFVTSLESAHTSADAYFYIMAEETIQENKDAIQQLNGIVFINAVTTTLDQLPSNCVRINAWPGFILSKSIEIVAGDNNKEAASKVLDTMKWEHNFVPDVPGMITPRTIAMIVNEAYFALGEDVSSKEDIDTAMKLGTGYPFGPFEWSERIGLKLIHQLLEHLASQDARYQPAPSLTKETDQ